MYKEVFIRDFSLLRESVDASLQGLSDNTLLKNAFEDSLYVNPLFSISMQKEALKAICEKFLNSNCLSNWLVPYKNRLLERNCIVGIIMAGNLPLVGFHDFLVSLASGCKAQVKLSGKDRFLLPALFRMLCEINPYWSGRVEFTRNLPENIHLLLAAGGEEAAKFFEYNYREIPKIVRGSRSSIAILSGNETINELYRLSKDVFLYYGMGCRSVSTLLVPDGYSFDLLIEAFKNIGRIIISEDYLSAYRYQKAIASMQNIWYIDGGFYLLRDISDFPPPMGVIKILKYGNLSEIFEFTDSNRFHLQGVVSRNFKNSDIEFGKAQYPSIDDYADGVNSLEFLLNNI
ncbi:MAG: acyl-CoA reductase [Rikenellaceae bacterium]